MRKRLLGLKLRQCLSNKKDKLLSSGLSIRVKTSQNWRHWSQKQHSLILVKKGFQEVETWEGGGGEVEREKEKQWCFISFKTIFSCPGGSSREVLERLRCQRNNLTKEMLPLKSGATCHWCPPASKCGGQTHTQPPNPPSKEGNICKEQERKQVLSNQAESLKRFK